MNSKRKSNKEDSHKIEHSCDCKSCICELLEDILEEQKCRMMDDCNCSILQQEHHHRHTIPFLLQTPYGNPFYTWGKIGSDDCFVTVFFKVLKVDCKKNCAVLQLLKPNVSIINPDTDCVEIEDICDVDYLTLTKETVVVELECYSAIKLISPKIVVKNY